MSFGKIISSSHLHLDKRARNRVGQTIWEPETAAALAMTHWAKLAKPCLTWKKRLGIGEKSIWIPVSTRSKGYQLGMSSTPPRSQKDLVLFVGLFFFFFFSENSIFWETTSLDHDNFSFTFQEKFLLILPYAKFLTHLPGAIYPMPICFQNFADSWYVKWFVLAFLFKTRTATVFVVIACINYFNVCYIKEYEDLASHPRI